MGCCLFIFVIVDVAFVVSIVTTLAIHIVAVAFVVVVHFVVLLAIHIIIVAFVVVVVVVVHFVSASVALHIVAPGAGMLLAEPPSSWLAKWIRCTTIPGRCSTASVLGRMTGGSATSWFGK